MEQNNCYICTSTWYVCISSTAYRESVQQYKPTKVHHHAASPCCLRVPYIPLNYSSNTSHPTHPTHPTRHTHQPIIPILPILPILPIPVSRAASSGQTMHKPMSSTIVASTNVIPPNPCAAANIVPHYIQVIAPEYGNGAVRKGFNLVLYGERGERTPF